MARAITRVELHEDDDRTRVLRTSSEEYETLHAEMWKRGFRRFVKSDTTMYQLPPAEYSYVGEATNDELYEKIKAAAHAAVKSAKRYSFVVVRTEEPRKWYNLKEIKKDPDA